MAAWIHIFYISFFSMVTVFASVIAYLRGSGKLGGGKPFLDTTAMPNGRPKWLRIQKNGSLWAQDAGGGKSIVRVVRGLFSKTDERYDTDEIYAFPPGNPDFFIAGRNELATITRMHLEAVYKQENMYRNHISWLQKALSNRTHNIDEILEKNASVLKKHAEAVMFATPRGPSASKSSSGAKK